jgi:hypothetical protein
LAGANRIPLSTALRGTLATVVPLAVYPRAGLGNIAYPALLGALATSMVDVVGPYRTRLIAVLVQACGGVPWPNLESQLAELVSQLSSGDASETRHAPGLLGRIVSDLMVLLGAAGYYRDIAALSGRALTST